LETSSNSALTAAEAKLDEEGRFRFTGIAPGKTVWIEVKAPHYQEYRTEELKSPRTNLELPAIVLEPSGMIEGMVVDSSGRPVPDARVTANSWDREATSDRSIAETTTDEGGYYQLLDIEPLKPVWIEIAHPDYVEHRSELFTSPRSKLTMPFVILNPLG